MGVMFPAAVATLTVGVSAFAYLFSAAPPTTRSTPAPAATRASVAFTQSALTTRPALTTAPALTSRQELTSRPALASRPASLGPMPKPLVDRWMALKERRAAALAFAKKLEKDGVEEAHRTFADLKRETAAMNDAIAPYAAASPLKYPYAMPKPGPGEAIWFYKACRAVEKYNDANRGGEDGPAFAVQKLTNEYREALGLLPLEIDERLVDSSRGHSSWMAQTETFDHNEDVPGSKDPGQRMTKAGYKWRGFGENIASGQPTAQIVFDAWFDSPHHHHNLVGNYTHLGVANVRDFWTQNFGLGEPPQAGKVR